MIVGNGQIAQAFMGLEPEDCVIFASGVSNSNNTDTKEFERERTLLYKTLDKYSDKRIIYFSSCALVDIDRYVTTPYYQHKALMESLIKGYSNKYYIFRLPQLFGRLKAHNTLINYLFTKIKNKEEFTIFNETYRYIIELNDVVLFVTKYLEVGKIGVTIDLANPYKYKVIEIVEILEILMKIKANYIIKKKKDSYDLNLMEMLEFSQLHNLNISFSKDYLKKKLIDILKDMK